MHISVYIKILDTFQ